MKLSHIPVKTGFHARLMSPLGRYPTDSFLAPDAAFMISPEMCFSIVRIAKENWGFSEVDILKKEEIPLLGTILLAGEAGTPYLYPYPTQYSVSLATDSLEDIGEQQIAESKSILLDKIEKNKGGYLDHGFHRPPCLGGSSYELISAPDTGERLRLFRLLGNANAVILRGVNCLLKARMAFQHEEFGEAACMYLWIAMDAAHSLILRRLEKSGVKNPTSKDAMRYFEEKAGHETVWERFFEDHYDNRIRAMHPANRFGAETIPMFLADDFLELNDDLIPLFEFFVSNFPDDFPQESATDEIHQASRP
jgi:hypothetical protein